MHAKHPEIARRWDAKYGSKIQPKSKKKKSTSKRRKKK